MTDEAREVWERKVRRWTGQINKLLSMNAPDSIVGHAVSSLFWLSVSYLGKDVTDNFSEILIEIGRQRRAVCQQCENPIPTKRSHPPYCDSCDAKNTVEYLKTEMDIMEAGEETGGE